MAATLNNYTNHDTGLTTKILCEILPLTADDAKNTLVTTYHLSDSEASNVIKYTHPDNPRPVIFVASSDMLQKAGWWELLWFMEFY